MAPAETAGAASPRFRRSLNEAKRAKREPAQPGVIGHKSKIVTQTEDVPAQYEAIEADDLVPSHNEKTFQPSAEHSGGQMRDYAGDKNEQQKVVSNSQPGVRQPPAPERDDPSPASGPPMVDEYNSAIGGNSRAMIAKRAYGDMRLADKFRDDTLKAGEKFGITHYSISKMQHPVIVRRLSETGMSADRLSAMSRVLQKGRTYETNSAVDAISRARILEGKPNAMHAIEKMLEDGSSARKSSAARGLRSCCTSRQDSGVMTKQELSQYATGSTASPTGGR